MKPLKALSLPLANSPVAVLENTASCESDVYPKVWKHAFSLNENVRFTRTPDIELRKKQKVQESSLPKLRGSQAKEGALKEVRKSLVQSAALAANQKNPILEEDLAIKAQESLTATAQENLGAKAYHHAIGEKASYAAGTRSNAPEKPESLEKTQALLATEPQSLYPIENPQKEGAKKPLLQAEEKSAVFYRLPISEDAFFEWFGG